LPWPWLRLQTPKLVARAKALAQQRFVEQGGDVASMNSKKKKKSDVELLQMLEKEALDELCSNLQIDGGYKRPTSVSHRLQ
jgi:hypothetical protein